MLISAHVQDELAAVRAEPDTRAATEPPADARRQHDASRLTADELESARRGLASSLALTRPNSSARVPILAHLAAIDTELADRADQQS